MPRWDLLCQVVDNYGDAGVLWRLARRLAADGQRTVRLWIDDLATLAALVPAAACGVIIDGVEIRCWQPDGAGTAAPPDAIWGAAAEPLPDVLVTGFDARVPDAWRRRMRPGAPLWITVEHLSAEAWVEGFHGSPSPKGDGLVEHFFYPGFSAASGGLLLEPGVLAARDEERQRRRAGVDSNATARALLFCYRPSPVLALARALRGALRPGPGKVPGVGQVSWRIAVPRAGDPGRWLARHEGRLDRRDEPDGANGPVGQDGKGGKAQVNSGSPIQAHRLTRVGSVRFVPAPFVAQEQFDTVLRDNDLNLVRGEDSQVRAIWAARPFLWQAWRQDLTTRSAKVEAFLGRQAPWLDPADQAALALLTRWWNGLPAATGTDAGPFLSAAFQQIRQHQPRIEAGLVAWGDALSRRELAAELIRFAGERAGRQL